MLKKTDAFLYSPGLPVRRIAGLLLPVILLLSLMVACQDPVPPEPYPDTDLLLEKLDVSCTEAWLKVSLSGTDSSAATAIPVILTRDGETLNNFSFTPPDTLIIDTGLEPARSYQYQAQRQSVHDNKIIASSNLLSVTTLDTTSHDFTFETFTFGGEPGTGSSGFYDVAIIDENNIWAVGNIVVSDPDSSFNGTGWKEYNAAHWNGVSWELVLIDRIVDFDGVFAFNANDVWFSDGCFIYRYDGTQFEKQWECDWQTYGPGQANAIWGSSPEDLWFVGRGGSIVHYDGSGFTRLESGTELPLHDIFGAFNPVSGEWEVFSVGSNFRSDQPFERVILKIENRTVRELSSQPMGYTLHSVWVIPDRSYFVAGSGIWHKVSLQEVDWQLLSLRDYYIFKIRGTVMNDIIAVGGYFDILHFNGLNWQRLDPGLPKTGNFKSVSMIGDLVVAVGFDSRRGIILKGQRY